MVVRSLALACAIGVALLPPAWGSAPRDHGTAIAAVDSVINLRRAKHAVSFFHMRYHLFSNTLPTGPTFFKCEKVVWPYCYGPRNGSLPFGNPGKSIPVMFRTAPDNVPKQLRKRIDAQVVMLMRELDTYQKRVPGDRWIMGQRVYHLVQHGEHERALGVARECQTDRWWCAALVGLVAGVLRQDERADSAYSVARATMPAADNCKWEDAADLLYDDDERSWYTRLACEEKVALNETLWWLADPLWLTPGNERRSEHYFREVFRKLHLDSNAEQPMPTARGGSDLQNPPMMVYALTKFTSAAPRRIQRMPIFEHTIWNQGALHSIVRALGVPAYFMVESDMELWEDGPFARPMRDGTVIPTEPPVLLQYPQPTYHFIPSLSAVRNPLGADVADWNLHDTLAAERYHPRSGTFTAIEHQSAFFRRGDSSRMVAAARFASDAQRAQSGDHLSVTAMILSRNPADMRVFRDGLAGTATTFSVLVPSDSTLIGLEAIIAGQGALRTRFAGGPPVMPRQRVSVSDILVGRIAADSGLPLDVDAAARTALPGTSINTGGSVTVFWEMYGMAAGDSAAFTLSASELGTSAFARIGRVLGVAGRETGAGVTWSEVFARDEPIAPRSMALQLGTLRRGRYRLVLEIRVPRQEPVMVAREITIQTP